MEVSLCALPVTEGPPFKRSGRGPTVPVLRIGVWAEPMPTPLEDGFVVDTGCDLDLVMQAELRDRIRAVGVRSRRVVIQWGWPVVAERYAVRAIVGGRWTKAEAYFPLSPETEDNLVGMPMLRFEAVCLRPPVQQTWVGRPMG